MVRVGSIIGFYFFPLVLAAVDLQKTLLFLALVPAFGLLSILAIKWDHAGKDVETEALRDEIANCNG